MSKLNFNDIGDDEIRVVKFEGSCEPQHNRSRVWVYVILLVGILVAIVIIVCCVRSCKGDDGAVVEQEIVSRVETDAHDDIISEKIEAQVSAASANAEWLSRMDASVEGGFVELVRR